MALKMLSLGHVEAGSPMRASGVDQTQFSHNQNECISAFHLMCLDVMVVFFGRKNHLNKNQVCEVHGPEILGEVLAINLL